MTNSARARVASSLRSDVNLVEVRVQGARGIMFDLCPPSCTPVTLGGLAGLQGGERGALFRNIIKPDKWAGQVPAIFPSLSLKAHHISVNPPRTAHGRREPCFLKQIDSDALRRVQLRL